MGRITVIRLKGSLHPENWLQIHVQRVRNESLEGLV